jgi:iron complex outermembrane receptor protein
MRHIFAVLALAASAQVTAQVEKAEQVVVITATPIRETALETTQPVSVLEGDALVRKRSASLGETLAAEPGVSASYFGPQASRPIVRGLGGERVRVYEDGADALDVSALSDDHAVSIDPLLADRIEIVRGPATLLYGNGASGGIVNVITHRIPERAPREPLAGAFELRGDSAVDQRSVAAHVDAAAGAFVVHADGFDRTTGEVSIPGFAWSRALREGRAAAGEEVDPTRGELPGTASDTRGGALGASAIGERGFVGLSGSRFETRYGIPGSEGISIDLAQERYDFSAELRDPWATIRSLRARATYNDYEHAELEPQGDVGTQFDQRGREARVTLEHVPLAGWRGVLGAQWRSIDLEALGEEAFVPPSKTRNLGVFLYEERAFGPLTLELGARLEMQEVEAQAAAADYDAEAWNGSAGLLWKFSPAHSLALQVTRTQRHPTATELYADGPHVAVQRFEVGDPTLGRERALTADLSLRRFVGAWRFGLTVFRSDYDDYIFPQRTGEEEDELPVAQYVQADARFTGVEAEIGLPALATPAGELRTRLMADVVRGELDDAGDLPQIPPFRAGLAFELTRGRVTAGLSLMQHDRQDRIAAFELPTASYTMLDVDLSYRASLGGGELLAYLRGGNLLDEDARRHPSPLKDVAPLPGRTIGAGLRFAF